jgi:uncharacterized membrane protein
MTHIDLLEHLRMRARKRRADPNAISMPDFAADSVAAVVGSWRFILIQTTLLGAWIVFNALGAARFDAYPFILLNLLLSFQAAYTAPIIMMSQNRQAEIDRRRAIDDFEINRKAELEIETLHEKLDLLREKEIAALAASVERLARLLEAKDSEAAA